ncbi:MAG: LURP-one-related family protein [Porcipelethomonas sp.]
MVALQIIPKGARYTVKDSKDRLIYNIKKSGFGGKFHLLDASGYKLYCMKYNSKEKKPVFSIFLNDKAVFEVRCTSMFLDPGFKFTGENVNWDIKSSDRRVFSIMNGDDEIGKIISPDSESDGTENEAKSDKNKEKVKVEKADRVYILEIRPDCFDDYVPLFAVCIEEAFGKMNKG